MAYDMYQDSQRAASRGIDAGPSNLDSMAGHNNPHPNQTTGRIQSRSPGLADEYYQQHGVRVSRQAYDPPEGPPPTFQVSSGQHLDEINGEVLKTAGIAPPSYEDSVGHGNGFRTTPTGDTKHRVPQQDADHLSETSSVFETTGVMTPTTEMDANQGHQANDLVAQATRSLASGDRKAPLNENDGYSQPRALESNDRKPHPDMDTARISSIAQWLSQHESNSERSVHERRPQEGEKAPSYERRDSFDEYWERHPEHRPENLGMSLRETKLAIRDAYRTEKRALKESYKAEKAAAKDARRQSKADFKAELKNLRRER